MIRLGADESHRRPPVFAASSAELCKTCNDCFVDEEVRRRDYGRESEAAAGDRGGRTVGGPLPSGWTPTRSLRTVSTIDRAENEPLSRSERWGSLRLHRSATEAKWPARRRSCLRALDVPRPHHARGCGKLASNHREAFGRNVAPWESPCEQTARRRQRALLLPSLAACEKGQITI